ncbi:MAG: 4-hydroxy-3-methylbut-2-enyl diphosphate reductase [Clostridia bacterium]|nr:4-hydroxy-3-methylbut-2-enyl diphosphate reductase [Clostridia bacterium]
MKFLLPKEIGFCKGVQSAINKALAVEGGAYCLGDIVHNKTVIEQLRQKGIVTVQSVDDVPAGATMIVRAHGAPPTVFEQAKAKNIKVIDATCPSVKAIQQKAQKYYNDGYQIVLVGDAKHPEIVGINGWCNNTALVFDGKSVLDVKGHEKVLVMFQTTFDTRFFEKSLKNLLSEGVKTLEIFNTICYTTTVRQYYAQILSKQSDLAIVVGDTNSSNTKRLFEIASQNCKTILTDGNVSEIAFDNNTRNVCFISGASTPEELVKGVFKTMTEIANDAVSVETVVTEKVMSKDEAMLAKAVNDMKEGHKYRPGNKVKCLVVQVSDDGVYVSIPSSKRNAFIPNDELALDGDYKAVKSSLVVDETTLECLIISVEKGITLSKKAIDERYKDDALVEGIKNGEIFEVKMTRVGKECLTGKLGSYTVIVHASQIKIGYVKNLETYLNKTLRLVVSGPDKVDDAKRVIFASQKAILLAEKKAKEDEFWNNIAVNEIVEGKVLRFAPFGAFVDVRGFDCLAHTSDLSWDRVNNPQEVLTIGETYEFVVLALDREKNRVSLGYKQLQPQPWQVAEEKYAVGSVVTGTVARVVPFGAFIQLDKSIDGLLHVSNVSWEWIEDINQVLKIGDEVQVEVLEFDGERKRITLSRKSLLPKPEQPAQAPATADEE